MIRLKTQDEIERDLRKAAQMIKDRAAEMGHSKVAALSIEQIVEMCVRPNFMKLNGFDKRN